MGCGERLMVSKKYADAVREVLSYLETNQSAVIEQAADMVIESITNGGAIYVHEIGHGNQGDWLNRAGGLAVLKPFTFTVDINSPIAECHRDRPRTEPFDKDFETIRYALRASDMRPGDVLLVSSVSGRSKNVVELALAAREMGIKVIGFTSMVYTLDVESDHPSKKRLFEAVDLCIDIGVPYGDAAVDFDGLDFKLLPVSGIAMITAGWMIWGTVVEKMTAAGNPPTVFMSVNRAGGSEYYKQAVEQYNRRGY